MKITTITIALLAAADAVNVPPTGVTTLREEATKKNVMVGSGAINPTYLNDPKFADVLTMQFNSLSPENEGKWVYLNPIEGFYNWTSLDRLVGFAEDNNMVLKGHGLISSCCNPDYLLKITEPTALRAALKAHFEAFMQRYKGTTVDRWDVVTEALKTQGGGLNTNIFHDLLGPDYIAEAFRIARAASPNAKLFINENLVESLPGKRQELYNLVLGLLTDGVPIDGVALQMHITEVAPTKGVLAEIVESYNALGLEVTIAEFDVHTLNATLQTYIYGTMMEEALEAGITDISFWGFTDKHSYTWVPGAKPLMFTEHYVPKGAFYATHTAFANFMKGENAVRDALRPSTGKSRICMGAISS
jgi:GH35 family endo-1,4-beta-xylanase